MGRKIFISFISLALLNLIGCYSISEVSKEEFINSKYGDAYLLTYNLEKYHFREGNYFVQNDTLNGIGEKDISGFGEVPFKGLLPLNTVSSFQLDYIDGLKTVGFIAATIVLVGLLIYTIFWISFFNALD